MADSQPDPRAAIDARVSSPGREGLTGTAPANRYLPIADREEVTIAPDFRPPEMQPAWRQDFPIDWPQDQYVERREFVKFMVLTSFALTVGQLWIALQNWWRVRRGHPTIQRIAALDDLPIGGSLIFSYPEEHDPCVLVRLADRELVAFSQKCTHLSCAVIPEPEQGSLRCPCHEGLFDLKSGKPIAGPPRRPLPRILLDVHGRDIFAVGIELRTS